MTGPFWGVGGGLDFGDYAITESVPDGWVLKDISCSADLPETTFDFVPAESVIIHWVVYDIVRCTFTNSPLTEAVGGVVIPANTLAFVAPLLAVIAVVCCIGTVVVVKKRRP